MTDIAGQRSVLRSGGRKRIWFISASAAAWSPSIRASASGYGSWGARIARCCHAAVDGTGTTSGSSRRSLATKCYSEQIGQCPVVAELSVAVVRRIATVEGLLRHLFDLVAEHRGSEAIG